MGWRLITETTIPSGGSISVTVQEDTDSDGTVDNSETFTLSGGEEGNEVTALSGSYSTDFSVNTTLSSAVESTPSVERFFLTIATDAIGKERTSTSSTTATANKATGSGVARTPDTFATSSPVGAARAIGKVNEANAGSTGDKATGIGKQNLDTVEATATPTDAKGIGKAESGTEVTLPAERVKGIGRAEVAATLDASKWVLDDTLVERVQDVVRTPKQLRLTIRASPTIRNDLLESYRSLAGKMESIPDENGRFRAEPLTSDAAVVVVPPSEETPPRQSRITSYVQKYSETVEGKTADVYSIRLTLSVESSREPDAETIDQSRSSGEWKFEFSHGTIATSNIATEPKAGSSASKGSYSITLYLTPTQTKALERSATYGDAVNVRNIPDGSNKAEDNNPDDRNTVTVTAPSGKPEILPGDTYVVEDWKSTRLDGGGYEVSLDLTVKG